MRFSAPVRVLLGVLIIAVTGTVGYLGTRAAQGAFSEDYRFTVTIGETGQGLVAGSDVAARGVLIGQVGEITLDEDLQAQVELILEPQHRIPADATFAVIGKTLFGEKQLEVRFDGDPTEAVAHIPDGGAITSPESVVEVQDVLAELDDLFGAIDPDDLAVVINDGLGAYVGQGEAIARAIDQGARATNVFARSLDDQVPSLRDLSLVAEALGPVGGEFNRLGTTIGSGSLDTLPANQAGIQELLAELDRFGDKLDTVLELTRPDLDRLIVEGGNVTRVLFAYRPELADMLEGLDDYTDTLGNGGQTSPGFQGFAAGFLIMLENPFAEDFCAGVPPELGAVIPACSGHAPPPQPGGGGSPLPQPPPAVPLPVIEIPEVISAAPEVPARGGLEDVFSGVLGDLDSLRGVAR